VTAQQEIRRGRQVERKTAVAAAVALIGIILGGAVLVATLAKQPTSSEVRKAHADAIDGPPRSIDQPNSGTKAKHNGDRGGWEQLALLGVLVVAVAVVGVFVFRSGGKARAGREAWKAAAATGRDGAASTTSPGP
jgi:hypothetical protein